MHLYFDLVDFQFLINIKLINNDYNYYFIVSFHHRREARTTPWVTQRVLHGFHRLYKGSVSGQ